MKVRNSFDYMRRSLILLISFGITFNLWAQSVKRNDHDTHKELVKAEKYIPGFVKDSVKACFPIYRVLVKKEYRNMKFGAVPKYKRIETYLDFDHATLDEVIATTPNWDYTLYGKYSNYNSYCYSKSKDNSLLSFIDSIKPDKLYFLFGQSDFLLVEKSTGRFLVQYADHKWKRCDLPELTNDLNEFNTFLFPYKEKKKLVYSK